MKHSAPSPFILVWIDSLCLNRVLINSLGSSILVKYAFMKYLSTMSNADDMSRETTTYFSSSCSFSLVSLENLPKQDWSLKCLTLLLRYFFNFYRKLGVGFIQMRKKACEKAMKGFKLFGLGLSNPVEVKFEGILLEP